MYKQNKMSKTTLRVNDSTEGETIEMKVDRILNSGEAIKDGAPMIYTERKEGVIPEYDVRTDKWDVAIDGMDKVSRARNELRTTKQEALEELRKKEKQEGGDPANSETSN